MRSHEQLLYHWPAFQALILAAENCLRGLTPRDLLKMVLHVLFSFEVRTQPPSNRSYSIKLGFSGL
jgi:hypothetical protein